jgi:hypothetical protein
MLVDRCNARAVKPNRRFVVSTSNGGAQMDGQKISFLKCDNQFKVTVLDRIIRGPFPA